MEIKTCEQYVLAEVEQLRLERDQAREDVRRWKKRAGILAQKVAAYEAAETVRRKREQLVYAARGDSSSSTGSRPPEHIIN